MDERLEEVKEDIENNTKLDGEFTTTILYQDALYIVQLAENVPELELDRNDWKDEAGKWCRRFHEVDEEHLETKEYLNLVIKQNQRYKEALEFYADEKNYVRPYDNENFFDYLPSEMDFDKGERARKELKGEST
ncbi:hypothetical protein [Oceanobacillus neutriphilus]|uniref:Uncharacterized protein n=1 Tax=Oceanobacillus neutriphilus TaxID=531815 RepID=A0ABQ2P4A5_9BACI|nr:hypothetical protein [Oceanobacillus neutriphilus]GGP17418.1 hypothetical protein GCM10011346_52960 [Oceanobacillus neutriphilus]